MKARHARISRRTQETKIVLRLNLDGNGRARVNSGVPFFDHMLTLFAKHATLDLDLVCKGDLAVDAHHGGRIAAWRSVRRLPPPSATNLASVATAMAFTQEIRMSPRVVGG